MKRITSFYKTVSPARSVALDILDRVLTHNESLMEALSGMDHDALGSKDAALAREIVSGTCRWLLKVRYYLDHLAKKYDDFPPLVQRILEMSLYQLLFLNRIPRYAIVAEAVQLTKTKNFTGLASAVNAILRSFLREKDRIRLPLRKEGIPLHLSVLHSHPSWIIEKWLQQWDVDELVELLTFNNTIAPLSLRVRGAMNTAINALQKKNIPYVVDERFTNRLELDSSSAEPELFESNNWVAQDGAAMLIAPILKPKQGWKVWDVCAAPGGKSIHLVDLARKKISLVSTDKSEDRLQKLQEQIEKFKIECIDCKVLDVIEDKIPFKNSTFDAILVDAPCSGWGTFRRHPDLRWRQQKEDIDKFADQAFEMLKKVHPCLKSGGILVYSTCTLSREENQMVIERFLAEFPKYTIQSVTPFIPKAFEEAVDEQGFLQIWPHKWQLDGAFAARLQKKT